MPGSREAWERVLAAIEADVRRSEALLTAPDAGPAASAPDGPPEPNADVLLPAEWLLPTAVELPPLESMPAVPAALSDRILGLRTQILGLQAELARAMSDLPRPPRGTLVSTPPEVPAFFDRRV